MIFRQLFDRDSCTYSYLIADESTREAVLIDPVFELYERDAALIRELGLQLRYTLDTHCHADHVTGAWLLKKRLGSKIALSEVYAADNVDVPLKHGSGILLGDIAIEARSTPGHTDGCLTFVTSKKTHAFTGDALLIRGAGRTDFQGGSAEKLYRSIRDEIFTLPNDCALFPAHDYNGRTMSTVAEEKRFNARIGGHANIRDFTGYMDNLGLPHPRKLDIAVPANLKCGRPENEPELADDWAPLTHTFAGIDEVDPEWVANNRDQVHIIDVRAEAELHEGLGKIPGSVLIPLDQLRAKADSIPSGKPIVTVCHAGKRSAMAVNILRGAGFSRVANTHGGMVEWRTLGLPVE